MSTETKLFKPHRRTPDGIFFYLGLPSRGELLHRAVKNGLDVSILGSLADIMKSNIQQVADWLGVSRTTLYRRLKSGRLSCPESDRIVGMASVLEAAARLFDDDREEAIRWMRTPLRGLGNKSPVQNLQTNVERDAVIELIYRLERGVFS